MPKKITWIADTFLYSEIGLRMCLDGIPFTVHIVEPKEKPKECSTEEWNKYKELLREFDDAPF